MSIRVNANLNNVNRSESQIVSMRVDREKVILLAHLFLGWKWADLHHDKNEDNIKYLKGGGNGFGSLPKIKPKSM